MALGVQGEGGVALGVQGEGGVAQGVHRICWAYGLFWSVITFILQGLGSWWIQAGSALGISAVPF